MSAIYQTEFDRENGISAITETLGGENVTQIFVHSVTSLDNVAEITSNAPLYPERSLLLARRHDIVCLLKGIEEEYFQFLHGLGIGPEKQNIIVLSESGENSLLSLPELIISNYECLARLKRLVGQDKKVALNPFIVTSKESRLALALERLLCRKVHLVGSPDIVDYTNLKHNVRAKAVELGVPVSEGDVVELELGDNKRPVDTTPIRVAIEKYIPKTGRVIIRGSYGASGSSLFIVENSPHSSEKALSEIAGRTGNRTYLVEVMLKLTCSPNIMMHIEEGRGDILCVSITDQSLTNNLMHEGNICPSHAKTLKNMLNSARKMSQWLQSEGYAGLVGFDFGEFINTETGNYEHFLAEINPRVNATVYPKSVIECLNKRQEQRGLPSVGAFMTAKTETSARSFAELQERYGHLFYKPETGKGLFPYITGWMGQGKFYLAIFGKSRSEVMELYKDFKVLLDSEPK